MPNIKSSEKDVKKSAEKRLYNKAVKSEVKSALKQAVNAVEHNGDDSADQVKLAISELDKAVSKGVIHKNKAARKKSRLMKKATAVREA